MYGNEYNSCRYISKIENNTKTEKIEEGKSSI